MITCPHCGRNVATDGHLQAHLQSCTKRPDVAAVVLACLTDADRPGCAVSKNTYDVRCVGTIAPTAATACTTYGTYEEFCAAFGLQSPRFRQATNLQLSYAEARRLADELHDGEYAPTGREYAAHASGPGVLSYKHLLRLFGGWHIFCVAANLILGTPEDYVRQRQERRVNKRLSKIDAPLTDEERNTEHRAEEDQRYAEMMQPLGLPVCRVRTLPNGATSYVIR